MKKNLVFITLIVLSAATQAVNYPKLTNFVTDTADLIEPEWEVKINALAKDIEKNTTAEIAVVTVDSLEGLTKEQYAVELFKETGIGKKDKNNGLLILVAKEEREYRFEVGYGLEPYVTDSMYVNIGKRIIEPSFKKGEFGKGIYEAVSVVGGLIEGQEDVLSKYQISDETGGEENIQALIVTLLIFMLIVYIIHKSKGKTSYPLFWGIPRYGGRSGGGFGSSGGFGSGGFGGFGGGFSGGGGFGGKW